MTPDLPTDGYVTPPLVPEPERVVLPDGSIAPGTRLVVPCDEVLADLYVHLVLARRFEQAATALALQGRLVIYPSALGQEACQVGAVRALAHEDWMFPSYRETAALVVRGIPVREALTFLRGWWHCGYDPRAWRTAPQCVPIATQAPHGVGVGLAARMRSDLLAVLVFAGDGATSEGDFAESLNLAAVFDAPAVFFVTNNQYALSVPLARQTRSPSLAHHGTAYGVPSYRVDGNDVVAVYVLTKSLLDRARAGGGPSLIEAVSYRMAPHTTADDDRRYRPAGEKAVWAERDPLLRLDAYLTSRGTLTGELRESAAERAEDLAVAMRSAVADETGVGADDALYAHVYSARRP